MTMNDYKPNSHRFKEEQKKAPVEKKNIEKVVKGNVITKKKGGVRKFADTFISEDAANVKSYILSDVIIPAAKEILWNIITGSADMILFNGKGRGKSSRIDRVSYTDYSKYDRGRSNIDNNRTRSGYSYDDITIESRGEAEEVLIRMDELIELYGQVSVADLYDLIGKTSEYTDNKYGWTNLRNAEPVRVRGGYMLRLPKVGPLEY